MKITIESTNKIVKTPEGRDARVWEGVTEAGVKCYLLVSQIAVHKDADNAQFEKELREQPPRVWGGPYDLRFFLN